MMSSTRHKQPLELQRKNGSTIQNNDKNNRIYKNIMQITIPFHLKMQ